MTQILKSLSLSLLLLTAAPASAEDSVGATYTDSKLQWGPCPPFLPQGCGIAVVHGDPSKPNVDVFFKVPAGSIIPSHTHTSAERMVLVAGRLDVTYEGEKTKRLKPGMYAYGPAGKPHSAVCAKGKDPCVLFIGFEAPLDAIPTAPAVK